MSKAPLLVDLGAWGIGKAPSTLEAAFMRAWDLIAGGKHHRPERDVRFHPERMWRFDFKWETEKVAVEMEGGVFTGGGHTRGRKYTMDCEKYNQATILGWRILRYTTAHVNESPVQMIEDITTLLDETKP